MRAMTSNLYLNPKLAGILLGPIVNMVNSLPFKKEKYLCPSSLMFAVPPFMRIVFTFLHLKLTILDNWQKLMIFYRQLD